MSKEEKNKGLEKRTDYMLAVFLIFLGGVLLLNTTGMIDWNIWTVLWRFWPLLIVFAGLSLIFEDNKILSIFVAFLAIVLLSLAFLWSSTLIDSPRWFERVVQEEADVKGSLVVSGDEYVNVEKKEIDVNMAVGKLEISNEGLENHLKMDSLYFNTWGEPEVKTKLDSETLKISLELGKKEPTLFWGSSNTPNYFLTLGTDEIATDLDLEIGAGQGKVSLRRYNLNDVSLKIGAGDLQSKIADTKINKLNLDVGAGNLVLELSGDIEVIEVINAKVGVGKLTLELPQGAEYKIEGEVGIGSINTPQGKISGFGNETKEIKSEGYDSAQKKFTIIAEVGIGELVIK